MGPSKTITFRSILPALVLIVTLNLSYLVLKGPTKNVILAYGYLWNAMFLAFPLAHVIARRASLRELGYRGHDPLRLYARGAAVGGCRSRLRSRDRRAAAGCSLSPSTALPGI